MVEMECGVALAKFYLSEASRLVSAAIVPAEMDKAEKLQLWLLKRCTVSALLVRDVVQLGPSPLRETPKAGAALCIFEKHGSLIALESVTFVRGAARKEAWRFVVRHLSLSKERWRRFNEETVQYIIADYQDRKRHSNLCLTP